MPLIPIFNSSLEQETVWKESLRIPTLSSNGAFNWTTLCTIRHGVLRERGDLLKLVYAGLGGGGTSISIVSSYFGRQATSGNALNFDTVNSTPVQITVNGSTSFTVPTSGIQSDPFTFDISPNVSYMISAQLSNSKSAQSTALSGQAGSGLFVQNYTPGDINYYFCLNVAQAGPVNRTGDWIGLANHGAIISHLLVAEQ